MKVALIGALATVFLCGPALSEGQVVRKLKACGSEATNEFGKHTERPATDEGNGFVGFETVDVDATGTKERFTLVNCATRAVKQIKAEYLLKDSKKGLPYEGDLLGFIEGLRDANKLGNPDLLEINASQAGFEVIDAKLADRSTASYSRADCGCGIYYPETMSSWGQQDSE